MSTKFGLLIDFDLLKARTSTNTKPKVVLSDRGRHLEKSIGRHIFAVAAVDPEWHVNNGDEVKIETEKSEGLKARNLSLVVQAFKPGCYSYVKGCVLAGVEQLYTGNYGLPYTTLCFKKSSPLGLSWQQCEMKTNLNNIWQKCTYLTKFATKLCATNVRFIRWASLLQVSKWDSIFFQFNNGTIETSRFR